jgi:hypothetical protein
LAIDRIFRIACPDNTNIDSKHSHIFITQIVMYCFSCRKLRTGNLPDGEQNFQNNAEELKEFFTLSESEDEAAFLLTGIK